MKRNPRARGAGNKELVAPSFVAVALAFDEARYPYGS
jgi:hypothetical protein